MIFRIEWKRHSAEDFARYLAESRQVLADGRISYADGHEAGHIQSFWVWLETKLKTELRTWQWQFHDFHVNTRAVWFEEVKGDTCWISQLNGLLVRAQELGLRGSRLRYAARLAQTNAFKAYRSLAAEIGRAIAEKMAALRRTLRLVRGFICAALLRSVAVAFAGTQFPLHNLISLQRRYYLAHGSHPNEASAMAQEGCRSEAFGGRVPAFLL